MTLKPCNKNCQQATTICRNNRKDIKTAQLRWFGHVKRVREDRLPKNIFEWQPMGRKNTNSKLTIFIPIERGSLKVSEGNNNPEAVVKSSRGNRPLFDSHSVASEMDTEEHKVFCVLEFARKSVMFSLETPWDFTVEVSSNIEKTDADIVFSELQPSESIKKQGNPETVVSSVFAFPTQVACSSGPEQGYVKHNNLSKFSDIELENDKNLVFPNMKTENVSLLSLEYFLYSHFNGIGDKEEEH
ncbi:hypothetical protein C0J52_12322 [Blattella germanica]|nr:hypothetical protein C0J52_12322 [Blattella germanica]